MQTSFEMWFHTVESTAVQRYCWKIVQIYYNFDYWHGLNEYVYYEIVCTAGWLNTLLSFKSQKRQIHTPVGWCTSVHQDERPLPPPTSTCFCQQSQQNQRSWFHPGLDSRFHRNREHNKSGWCTHPACNYCHPRRGGRGCAPSWWSWARWRQGLRCGQRHTLLALHRDFVATQNF